MSWLLWGVVLLAQNASFTLVSRARNSASLAYHAIAAVFSNGVWFLALAIGVDKIAAAREASSTRLFLATLAFYTAFTVVGSVSAHHLLMKYVEKGKRKVGA
jgi:hypothetical protein